MHLSSAFPSGLLTYILQWSLLFWTLWSFSCGRLTTVGSLVDMAGPQSGWLLCLALGGPGCVMRWLITKPQGSQG